VVWLQRPWQLSWSFQLLSHLLHHFLFQLVLTADGFVMDSTVTSGQWGGPAFFLGFGLGLWLAEKMGLYTPQK
jgi:hypothetical protein